MRTVPIERRPLAKGDRLLCVDAKECGIPLIEGQLYTVQVYSAHGGAAWGDSGGDGLVKDRLREPGVETAELPGNYFLASRFELVADNHA
jgi:hypothetical protein